jgi:hypothetical protein
MKNSVCWVVTACGSCKNRRFGGTYRPHHQGDKNRRARGKVASYCYRCSYLADSCHFDDELVRSSELSVLTAATRRNIPVDGILQLEERLAAKKPSR